MSGARKETNAEPQAKRAGSRRCEGKQGVAKSIGLWKPQVPGGAKQDKGRRRRAFGAGRAAQKTMDLIRQTQNKSSMAATIRFPE